MAHKTGHSLKVERVKAGARQRDIARYMGVSAARVSTIERSGNLPATRVDPDTAARYVQAVADFVAEKATGEPQTWRVQLIGGIGSVGQQYMAAKQQARIDTRRNPAVRSVEVMINDETPGASVVGYLDGLQAAGVSPVLLDSGGIIVNRRVG